MLPNFRQFNSDRLQKQPFCPTAFEPIPRTAGEEPDNYTKQDKHPWRPPRNMRRKCCHGPLPPSVLTLTYKGKGTSFVQKILSPTGSQSVPLSHSVFSTGVKKLH